MWRENEKSDGDLNRFRVASLEDPLYLRGIVSPHRPQYLYGGEDFSTKACRGSCPWIPLEKPLETHKNPASIIFSGTSFFLSPSPSSLLTLCLSLSLSPSSFFFFIVVCLVLFRAVEYRLKEPAERRMPVVGHFVNLSPGLRRMREKTNERPLGIKGTAIVLVRTRKSSLLLFFIEIFLLFLPFFFAFDSMEKTWLLEFEGVVTHWEFDLNLMVAVIGLSDPNS